MPSPELITVISLLCTIGMFLIAIPQVWAVIYPLWLERQNQKTLNEKFSRGPYDRATIERATKYYIRPKCSNIDPAQEQELRHALMATREDLFEKVDYFIAQDVSHRHLLILADSGMGKTSFVLNYYAYNSHKSTKTRCQIALVPLGIKNVDELIDQIPNKDEFVLFLDALDEDKKAIADHHERIAYLMDKSSDFKKIIITCRTQFFSRSEEIPNETGILKLGPRKAGEKGTYAFWKLYLSPFDDNDIKKYIYKRYSFWMRDKRKKALRIAQKISLLAIRPMLLAHIPDIIAKESEILYTYQVYEIMVDAWLEREVEWVDKRALRIFSENLAVDFYINQPDRDHDGIKYYRLSKLAQEWGIELQDWQLGGRSLLNRDVDDYFKFSHRSILEYLFMKKMLFDNLSTYGILLTDQMTLFLGEMYPNVSSLGDLLSIVDKNMVFNFIHDTGSTVVKKLHPINWARITENKFGDLENITAESKMMLDRIAFFVDNINKSDVISVFPDKNLTVLEIFIHKKPTGINF